MDPATPDIYTLSLHDALPISLVQDEPIESQLTHRLGELRKVHRLDDVAVGPERISGNQILVFLGGRQNDDWQRSEEHTSELQSRLHLVCRLLLEKKNQHSCRH